VAIAAICLLIALLVPRLSPRASQLMGWGLAGFALANSLAWDLWQRANGLWSPAYSLPFHLCTFAVPFAALTLLTRSYRLYEVLYFWGFAGVTQALLTPDLTTSGYNFPHFVYWIFWTSHGVILWACRLRRGRLGLSAQLGLGWPRLHRHQRLHAVCRPGELAYRR